MEDIAEAAERARVSALEVLEFSCSDLLGEGVVPRYGSKFEGQRKMGIRDLVSLSCSETFNPSKGSGLSFSIPAAMLTGRQAANMANQAASVTDPDEMVVAVRLGS